MENNPILNSEVDKGLSEIKIATLKKELKEKIEIDDAIEGIAKASGIEIQKDLIEETPKTEVENNQSEKISLGSNILKDFGFRFYTSNKENLLNPEVKIEDLTKTNFPKYFISGLLNEVSDKIKKEERYKEVSKIFNAKNIRRILIKELEIDNYSSLNFQVNIEDKKFFSISIKEYILEFNLDLSGNINLF